MRAIILEIARCARVSALLLCIATPGLAQQQPPADSPMAAYGRIRAFELNGAAFNVENLVLKRDRVQMTFTGSFYFSAPILGQVTGAVFRGQGSFSAPIPPVPFERDNVRRLLKADKVESSFQTAVMIFTDDTFQQASAARGSRTPSALDNTRAATEFIPRVLKETGANLAARALASILNHENPGFFFGDFSGSERGRFNLLLDYQNRIPVANFQLNGGEVGIIYSYHSEVFYTDIWTAFCGQGDYERGIIRYSDSNDLVDIKNYVMDLDLREPKKTLKLAAKIDMLIRAPRLHVLSMNIGESLPERDSDRLKKQLRLKTARVNSAAAEMIQADWEGGFSVILPTPAAAGQTLTVEVELEGDFMREVDGLPNCYYPYSNEAWFPRHGYLQRSTYDLTFHHRKEVRIAATGARVQEEADPASREYLVTRYRMEQPVALAVFAVGPFERHQAQVKWEGGGQTPMEFNSLPGSIMAVNENFMLSELDNAIRYFTALFGKYPYSTFGAAIHPFGCGQGFATMLMLPPAGTSSKNTFSFISHETSHQWWGNIVAWRSYRDQWLSEGFAKYSGILYTGKRDSAKAAQDLVNACRESLKKPPRTTTGVGDMRLNDVGPIILGHRLESTQTAGSYSALIYNKGALVLRMLHFLFIDPTNGNGQAFFDMMADFVNKFRGKAASTDDFRAAANEHFAGTPAAKRTGLRDLNWFFDQWVYQTALPSYRLEYVIEDQPDGTAMLRGTIFQENAPENWRMILPLVFSFGNNQSGTADIMVSGAQSPVALKLPRHPAKVELDPDAWVLSEKTSTRSR